MSGGEGQTFCLRWNNHKSNLVEILDALIKRECYVDCTIVVDEQIQFKAHRVVLAANSPYFQAILQDVPMDHCSILFPGVKEFEMRALLEYMYTGEVNVTEGQISRIMQIARQLEVKGLTDMDDLKGKIDTCKPPQQQQQQPHSMHQTDSEPPMPFTSQLREGAPSSVRSMKTSPVFSSGGTSNNITSAAQSSSSPPYNNFKPYQSLYQRSPVHVGERAPWSLNLESPSHPGLLSRAYETAPDNCPLKRKKMSSMNSMLASTMDTPILRNVLAQTNAPDSSPSMPLIPSGDRDRRDDRASNHSNGNEYGSENVSLELFYKLTLSWFF